MRSRSSGCCANCTSCWMSRLPSSSAGCDLPAITNCTGRSGLVRIAFSRSGSLQHEGEPLVGRHAAGEADGQGVGVEHLRDPLGGRGARALLAPRFGEAAAGVFDELQAHAALDVPELAVAERRAAPVGVLGVARAERRFGDAEQGRVGPRRRVHAVGDRGDRHLVGVEPGPEVAEHAPADLSVQLRDAVRVLREPQPHDRHVERARRRVGAGLDAEGERVGRLDAGQQRARDVPLDESAIEPVDARGNRRVRREHRARAHELQRLGEREPLADVGGDALEAEEAGVPLVHVEHVGRGRAAERGECPHRAGAADAEQQLLQQAVLAAAAVETVGDRAQLVGVRGDVGVEQQQRDATDGRPSRCGRAGSRRRAARG